MEKRISGHTGLMGLFGSPVGHSGSPAMYNFSFQHDGLDYAYLAFDVTEEQKHLRQFVYSKCALVTLQCHVKILQQS